MIDRRSIGADLARPSAVAAVPWRRVPGHKGRGQALEGDFRAGVVGTGRTSGLDSIAPEQPSEVPADWVAAGCREVAPDWALVGCAPEAPAQARSPVRSWLRTGRGRGRLGTGGSRVGAGRLTAAVTGTGTGRLSRGGSGRGAGRLRTGGSAAGAGRRSSRGSRLGAGRGRLGTEVRAWAPAGSPLRSPGGHGPVAPGLRTHRCGRGTPGLNGFGALRRRTIRPNPRFRRLRAVGEPAGAVTGKRCSAPRTAAQAGAMLGAGRAGRTGRGPSGCEEPTAAGLQAAAARRARHSRDGPPRCLPGARQRADGENDPIRTRRIMRRRRRAFGSGRDLNWACGIGGYDRLARRRRRDIHRPALEHARGAPVGPGGGRSGLVEARRPTSPSPPGGLLPRTQNMVPRPKSLQRLPFNARFRSPRAAPSSPVVAYSIF